MQITFSTQKSRFELSAANDDEGALALKSGFQHDSKSFCYHTKSPELVRPFLSYSDIACQARVQKHSMNVLLSKAASLNGLTFPCPTNREYLPFQLPGIAYTLPRSNTLIGDDPGLGKTIQAAGVINAEVSTQFVLVVCPATIKVKWARELSNWLVRSYTIGIATTDYFPPTNIVIINYDIVYKLRGQIDLRLWDILIIDESHMLTNPEAKRTKAVLGYTYRRRVELEAINAKRRIFLTGTPMVNRPENLWMVINSCDREDLGSNWNYYATRYCKLWKAPWGWDSSGAANLEELQGRLRGTFMIRRKKSEVLDSLPAKRRQIIPLDSTNVANLVKRGLVAYEELKGAIQMELEVRQKVLELTLGDEAAYLKAVGELDLPGEETRSNFSGMAKLRGEEAVAKVPYTIEYCKMLLEEEEKLVIFGHHTDPMFKLQEAFKSLNAVLLYGGIEIGDPRQRVVDTFQQNPKCRVIICGITLAIGFELTAASRAVLHERDWRPSVVTQAEDRLHRIGQKGSVMIDHLVFDGSFDSLMVKQLIEKQEVIDQAIG